MGVSVITLTRDTECLTVKACRDSVSNALFSDAKHEVIVCPDVAAFNKTRFYTSIMDEYTAVVDYDDQITPDALKLCYAAMKEYNLDLVFTDEIQYNVQSKKHFLSMTGQRSFRSIRETPQAIHHLVMIRSSMIDEACLNISQRYFVGIDWFIHASVALTGKVMHIPKVCYTWNRHNDQLSTKKSFTFNHHYNNMKKSISETWGTRDGLIPQADIAELESIVKKNNW